MHVWLGIYEIFFYSTGVNVVGGGGAMRYANSPYYTRGHSISNSNKGTELATIHNYIPIANYTDYSLLHDNAIAMHLTLILFI